MDVLVGMRFVCEYVFVGVVPTEPIRNLKGGDTPPQPLVKIYGSETTPTYEAAKALIERSGHTVTDVTCMADLAIAPLLTEILPAEALGVPAHGTLIFHPSPLPYGRGASAIKYAYKRQEPITAATWFWADSGIDTGDREG